MSRVAKMPVPVPAAVEISTSGRQLTVKGPKGTLEHLIHGLVEMARDEGELNFRARNESKDANALAGTTRAVVSNMLVGVSEGFEKKLELVGVGYRAQARGNVLNSARAGLTSMEHWYGLPEAMFVDRTIQDYPLDYNYQNEKDRFVPGRRIYSGSGPVFKLAVDGGGDPYACPCHGNGRCP